MKMFEDFILSDAFFPVLIGLMILLVLIFVWVLLSGKKKLNKQNNASVQMQEKVVEDSSINPLDDLKRVEEVKPIEENISNTTNEHVEDIVVNLPINEMDETPVDVIIPKDELNDVGEIVVIEQPAPLVEEGIPEEEIVNIDIPTLKSEEHGEEVEIPETKAVVDDSGETVELPVEKPLLNEVGEEAVAFDTIPEANHNINNDVKVEPKQEYMGEKTEIFDFPDFNNIENKNDAALTGNVEEDVIKAANNYISTVFKEN